jgi:sarcosine oxidase
MPSAAYDAIVLGAGGVGSAAMWQLAKRGLRVLGIDRFHPPHDRGSSHGHTRIIRQAYFEHADYVPLLLESYRLWEALEELAGCELKRETGLLEVGPPDGIVVSGVLTAARQHGLEVDQLTAAEIERRWPAFRVPPGLVGVFERRGGLLHVERCVQACLDAARDNGAELLTDVEVKEWTGGHDIVLRTTAGDFHTGKLIVTAGAWAGPWLSDLGIALTVRRKTLLWYQANDGSTHADAGFPCYLFELPLGVFYGFPAIDNYGVKVAEHSGGAVVDDPLKVDRALHESDHTRVDGFVRSHLPAVESSAVAHAACLYTMSPDEHFIVDRHPDDERVVFAAGLSGHGFKFTPVLGRVLADVAVDGCTDLSVSFLSLSRFWR